jgi:glycosyltransferase involved in cell wall biosynthesis
MKKTLLFIPAYNCEKQITRTLNQIDESVRQYVSEVIVVNNRSTDGTESAVIAHRSTHPEIDIKLLRNNENYNLGGSHKVAFDYAINHEFDYIVVLHGDDQGDIRDALPLFLKRIHHDCDCLLGSRFMKGSKTLGYSHFRIFGNHIYNLIFSVATMSKVKDLGSGLNIYNVNMLRNKFYMRFPDELMFNCFMLFANKTYKIKSQYFPVTWREEDQVSNVKMLSQAINTLKYVLKFMLSNKKKFIRKEFRSKPIENYGAIEINEVQNED